MLTLFCVFFIGLSEWEFLIVVAHSMTTISTGGFSTHTNSIGYFNSSYIEIIATIFIILGSIPFYNIS